jgi:hypothetical protein
MALGCGAIVGANGAQACGNGKVTFEDKFETLDPSWGKASDRLSGDKGALVIKAEPGQGRWAISQSDYYTDRNLRRRDCDERARSQLRLHRHRLLVSGQ